MSKRVQSPDTLWLQYCRDGSLGQFWWAAGDVKYLREDACDHCAPEERAVIDAAFWWHAEINRTRSTSVAHVALEEFEQELFATVSALLTARAKTEERG